jgi:hypothetical protein
VWDPIAGCVDPMIAERRAKAFAAGTVTGSVAGGRNDNAARFYAQETAKVLQGFFHAAALTGRSLEPVLEWVAHPVAAEQPAEILRQHPHAARFWDGLLHGALTGSPDTVGNTVTTVQQAMGLFFQPEIRRRCVPGPLRPATDLADLITWSARETSPRAPIDRAAAHERISSSCRPGTARRTAPWSSSSTSRGTCGCSTPWTSWSPDPRSPPEQPDPPVPSSPSWWPASCVGSMPPPRRQPTPQARDTRARCTRSGRRPSEPATPPNPRRPRSGNLPPGWRHAWRRSRRSSAKSRTARPRAACCAS